MEETFSQRHGVLVKKTMAHEQEKTSVVEPYLCTSGTADHAIPATGKLPIPE
jgi:hypothetical protein